MRRMITAGNWKMNKTPKQAVELIKELIPVVKSEDTDVVFCVPAVCIPAAVAATEGTNIKIGAQNMHFEENGAFTGEIAPSMLTELGVEYVVIGHSERREYYSETNETVNKKAIKALEHGLVPIVCCGEYLEQREQGVTVDLVRQQLKVALLGISAEDAKKVVIAYEPIWAIGTGVTASAEQAEEVCAAIRELLVELYGTEVAEAMRIQYGGSVKGSNAAELFTKPNIDGGLVGGASLTVGFGEIINFK